RSAPLDARERAALREIRAAGERAARLARQLLAVASHQPARPETLNLNDAVHGARSLLQRLLGPGIELDVALDPGAGPIEAAPGEVDQVLINLAVNARDAMPQGGRFSITTQEVTLPPHGPERE